MDPKRVVTVFLESTAPGTAAGHHLTGTVRRLSTGSENLRVTHMVRSSESGFLRRVLEVYRSFISVRRDADVLVVRYHPLLWPLLASAWVAGLPYVLLVQGAPSDVYTAGKARRALAVILNRMIHSTIKNAAIVVAVNETLSRHLQDEYGRRADLVIRNGAPEPSGLAEPSVSVPEKFVLFAGAFAEWQGLPVLIESLSHQNWPEDTHLVVAGSGALEDLVSEAAISGKLTFVGHVTPEELATLIRKSIATLSPKLRTDATRFGISPFKVMESIAAGVPVICTDLPGQRELVEEGDCGIVVTPGSIEELVDAVRTISNDPALHQRLSRNCREYRAQLSWENDAGRLSSAVVKASSGSSE